MRLAVREALLGFRRAPMLSMLSITTIAFSLFAFGLFSLVALNIRSTLSAMESRVEIRAFLSDSTTPESIAAAMGDIGGFKEVARVEYITPEQALERARLELGEFKDVFEAGFLPASLDVRMREGYRDPETVKKVADRVKVYDFVDDVRYGEEWVQKLYSIRNVATAAGIILGLAFAAVSIIVIGATIRMAVMARSREISIMRLVGATDGFIRRPFLIEGLVKGVLGGAFALLLTRVASSLISRYFIQTEFFDTRLALLGLLGGAVIGVVGSALSVGRQIRRVQ
ncbi:MAG: ABC transporter permease [Gemmatimonadetes bacterium]|nr:ABC transporter permease [Gemmatimonadota bacterium]MCC6773200.1 ABC transporter permease [Gemmatimonadaceae bacterium]